MKTTRLFCFILMIGFLFYSCHNKDGKGKKKGTLQVLKPVTPKPLTGKTVNQIGLDTTQLIHSFNDQMQDYAKDILKNEDTGSSLYEGIQDALSNHSLYDFLRNNEPIITGDINHDHLPDALVPFTVEGRGGGNNWDSHIAVFLREKNGYHLQLIKNSGADLSPYVILWQRIINDTIWGMNVANNFEGTETDSIQVKYILQNDSLHDIK